MKMKGLVLGQDLMVIPSTGDLLYIMQRNVPFINIMGVPLLLFVDLTGSQAGYEQLEWLDMHFLVVSIHSF